MGYKPPKPDTVDPFWPTEPEGNTGLPALVEGAPITNWTCRICGTHVDRNATDPGLCNACYKKHAADTKLSQKVNANWMEQSEALGLSVFERQPAETDLEWMIWQTYRGHYPMKLPTWTELAKECSCSVAAVTRAAQRWSFRARMQAWARYTDDANLEARAKAIKEMNERQVNMAKRLQDKLSKAIDSLEPMSLKPSEMVQLFKVASELERRIVTATPEKVEGTVAAAAQKQQQLTKPEDLSEVVAILSRSGVLPGQGIAVEQTTTTRIVAKGEDQEVIVVDGV